MNSYSVCVVGNSHTAAYHQAWKNRLAPELPGVSLTFFAATSQKLRRLIHEDGAFTTHDTDLAQSLALSSGGMTGARIAAYDAFVAVGLGVRADVATLCETYGTVTHRQWGPVDELISNACFVAMVEASFKDKLAFWLLERVREAGSRPVLICPTPFRSDKELSWAFMRRQRRFADETLRGPIIAQCQEIGSALALRHGGEIIWQDEATLSTPGFTRAEFAQDAARLAKPTLEDGMHMNESFGAEMLGRVLKRLDELSGGRVFARALPRALKRA